MYVCLITGNRCCFFLRFPQMSIQNAHAPVLQHKVPHVIQLYTPDLSFQPTTFFPVHSSKTDPRQSLCISAQFYVLMFWKRGPLTNHCHLKWIKNENKCNKVSYPNSSSQSNRLGVRSLLSSWSLQNCTTAWKISPTFQDFSWTSCTTSKNWKGKKMFTHKSWFHPIRFSPFHCNYMNPGGLAHTLL